MEKTIGFIGAGNMGGAMIGGMVSSGLVTPDQIIASELNGQRRKELEAEFGIRTTSDMLDVVALADYIILAVKPYIYDQVMETIGRKLREDQVVISIAAGMPLGRMEAVLGEDTKIVKTMPNTPALVGQGMTAVCTNGKVSEVELEEVMTLFRSFGKAEQVPEHLFDAVIGASGSSPAYMFMFLEAIADAVVKAGMPRQQAYTFAAQAMKGAAEMVLETGQHPGALKDMVCSPGGTTIEAVTVLDQEGLRGAVTKAVDACVKKSIEMNQ